MFLILPKVGRYRNMSTIVASCDDWRRQLFATRCFSCHVRLRDVDDVDHDGDADCDDDDDVGNDNDNGDGNCLFHAASLAMCVAVMVAMMTMMVMMIILI